MRLTRVLSIPLIGMTACRDSAVAIRVGGGDTILIHSMTPVTVPATLVDSKGREVHSAPMRYSIGSGTVLRQPDSASIECTGPGDGSLRISSGALQAAFVVRCRPIRYIVMKHSVRLVVGGGPAPLDIGAMGTDGRALDALGIKATVRDTSIAVVRNGQIYPRRPGRTVIEISLGCQTWIEVTVHAPAKSPEAMASHEIFTDSVTLAPGEHRFWRLPPGKYEVQVVSNPAAGLLTLSTFQSDCREDRVRPGKYTCLTRPGGSLIVRPGSSRATSGRITILRTDGPPLPPEGSDASRRIPRNRMCGESLANLFE